MNEADWELFNAQFNALSERLREQAKRADELETRVAQLEQSQRTRATGAEVFDERLVFHIAALAPAACPRCPIYHSPELPCPTPAGECLPSH